MTKSFRVQKTGDVKKTTAGVKRKNLLYLFCVYKNEGRKRKDCIPVTNKLMPGFLTPSIFYRTQTIKPKRIILYIT